MGQVAYRVEALVGDFLATLREEASRMVTLEVL
jgi:hypothetical protein